MNKADIMSIFRLTLCVSENLAMIELTVIDLSLQERVIIHTELLSFLNLCCE